MQLFQKDFRVEIVVCRAPQITRVFVRGGNTVIRVHQTGKQHSGIEHSSDQIRILPAFEFLRQGFQFRERKTGRMRKIPAKTVIRGLILLLANQRGTFFIIQEYLFSPDNFLQKAVDGFIVPQTVMVSVDCFNNWFPGGIAQLPCFSTAELLV